MSRKSCRRGLASGMLVVALVGSTGCAMTSVALPSPTQSNLAIANRVISAAPAKYPRRLGQEESEQRVDAVFQRLKPAATQVCQYIGQDECVWKISLSDNPDLNAFATGEDEIVIFQGIVDYSDSDDQLALVVAHEMSHHIANHMDETKGHAAIGGLLMGVLAIVATKGSYQSPDASQKLVGDSFDLGATIGARSYSKQQEREADYLAIYILERSGYDINEAKAFLVTMAKSSQLGVKRLQGFLGTHPSGPERLAIAEMTVQEIQSDGRTMPRKRGESE